MEENITNPTGLTEKEVFDQIVLLQKQLTENSPTSLHRLSEALYDARGEGEGSCLTDDQVSEICKVFAQREETLNQMLNLYRSMYIDLKKQKQEEKKAEPESEDTLKRRKEFLAFVRDTSIAIAGASSPGAPGFLPDFEKIWKTVFLGQ
ncbi:MAG: hypothetical protein IJ011_02975 [Clostridia bacterium]|nr:hypothetical protein [Clostridia bacterium]